MTKIPVVGDEMAALVVHDIKNPLSVILSGLDFIAQRLPAGDEELASALRDCQISSRRILRIIANLLDLAKFETGRFEIRPAPLLIADLVEQVSAPRIAVARARNVALTANVDRSLRVQADVDLLTRVVENVLDNSMRYAPSGGHILIIADTENRHARIRIGNDGPPVPHEMRALIFEKHGQCKPGSGSMNFGLGLYFCRLAVEAHGGRIYVADEPLPAVFSIELPL